MSDKKISDWHVAFGVGPEEGEVSAFRRVGDALEVQGIVHLGSQEKQLQEIVLDAGLKIDIDKLYPGQRNTLKVDLYEIDVFHDEPNFKNNFQRIVLWLKGKPRYTRKMERDVRPYFDCMPPADLHPVHKKTIYRTTLPVKENQDGKR